MRMPMMAGVAYSTPEVTSPFTNVTLLLASRPEALAF